MKRMSSASFSNLLGGFLSIVKRMSGHETVLRSPRGRRVSSPASLLSNSPSLSEAASSYDDFVVVRKKYRSEKNAIVFESVMRATAREFSRLSEAQRYRLKVRIKQLPPECKSVCLELITALQQGAELRVGLAEELLLQSLRGHSDGDLLEKLFDSQPEEESDKVHLLEAACASLNSRREFQQYGIRLIQGQGVSVRSLLEFHFPKGETYARSSCLLKFYSHLKHATDEDARRVCLSFELSRQGDVEAQEVLDFSLEGLSESERRLVYFILKNESKQVELTDKVQMFQLGLLSDASEIRQIFNSLSPEAKHAHIIAYGRKYEGSLRAALYSSPVVRKRLTQSA